MTFCYYILIIYFVAQEDHFHIYIITKIHRVDSEFLSYALTDILTSLIDWTWRPWHVGNFSKFRLSMDLRYSFPFMRYKTLTDSMNDSAGIWTILIVVGLKEFRISVGVQKVGENIPIAHPRDLHRIQRRSEYRIYPIKMKPLFNIYIWTTNSTTKSTAIAEV